MPGMIQAPFVSVIVPCRNEAPYIRLMIRSLLDMDYPRHRLEAVFADGRSDDGTLELLQEVARAHPFIRVIDNPGMTAPSGLNAAIRQARGEIIMRMDAHSAYPCDYVKRCVSLLRATGAGCAGGRSVPVLERETPWARAAAAVTSHPFGVGNSACRVYQKRAFVDTVAFGTFPRRVFDDVGFFDERLTRNQDNELAARLRRRGYKIAYDPSIEVAYFSRATLKGLSRQAFQNGLWNAYTLVLHPYTWKARYFVPAAFVAYLAFLTATAAVKTSWAPAAALPLALYGAIVARIAATTGPDAGGVLRVAATVVAWHVSYGCGTHFGAANLLTGRWRGHLGRPIKK
jgi:succinoglycan biosynthesis protein ExoA